MSEKVLGKLTMRETRLVLNITQRELADELGWSSTRHVSRIENGGANLTLMTALALECLIRRAVSGEIVGDDISEFL